MKIRLIILCSLLPCITQAATPDTQQLTLRECISTALTKHQSLQVTEAAVLMAEAQYQQAMSAYWPQLSIDVSANRADEDRTYSLQGAAELSSELTSALASIGAKSIKSIPLNKDLKLIDRDLLTASINLTYPIFTGGKRSAIVNQAEKADACLVARHILEDAIELNPAIQNKIKIIHYSGEIFIPVIYVAFNNASDITQTRFSEAVDKLHNTVRGQQILDLFGVHAIHKIEQEKLYPMLKINAQLQQPDFK